MSTRVGWATLQIIPSTKDFGKTLGKDVDPQLDATGKKSGGAFGGALLAGVGKFAGPLAAVFAGVQVGGFLKDAITQASDLSEAANKLNTVFGTATGSVMDFAKAGASGLGQSNLAVQNAAAMFGVYGKAAGLAGAANADFSTQLVQLSTDLASFYNTHPTQAVEAITAGLRGESEPLRAYGVLLDDATLRQEALRLGLIKTTKNALTPQQRVLAAQAAIMRQSTVAQGDFAKTSNGLANQQRILTAQWENAKATLGQAFLPAITGVVQVLNKGFAPAMKSLTSGASKLPTIGRAFSTLFDPANDDAAYGFGELLDNAFGNTSKYVDPLTRLGTGILRLKSYFASLTPSLKAIGATFADLGRFLGSFFQAEIMPALQWLGVQAAPLLGQAGAAIRSMIDALVPALGVLGLTLKTVFGFLGPPLVEAVKFVFGAVIGIVSGFLTVVQGVWQIVKGIFTGDWSLVWTGVQTIFAGVWRAIESTLVGAAEAVRALAVGLFGGLVSLIGSKLAEAGRAVGSWAGSVASWFADLGRRVGASVSGLASSVASGFTLAMSRARSAVVSGASSVVTGFDSLRDKAIGAVSVLASRFVSIGADVVSGFIRGVQSNAGRIISAVRAAITDKLPSFVKDALGIHSPSRVFAALGRNVSEGMALGINQRAGKVTKAVSALTQIPDAASVNVGTVPRKPGDDEASSGGPLIGSLTISSTDSVRDQLDEVNFALRRIRRGGVYA
ncbi:hypothetical protein OG792_32845 [Micromonospora sp. NBC_01699]|uniref:phage tail protein n=1 Tax=Micromonospora sp. NBC_01699 TaxID=2975984 RepID=UPI002E2C07B8|nr:hypothetical protein [Micromonospora sp. NBC_01699]